MYRVWHWSEWMNSTILTLVRGGDNLTLVYCTGCDIEYNEWLVQYEPTPVQTGVWHWADREATQLMHHLMSRLTCHKSEVILLLIIIIIISMIVFITMFIIVINITIIVQLWQIIAAIKSFTFSTWLSVAWKSSPICNMIQTYYCSNSEHLLLLQKQLWALSALAQWASGTVSNYYSRSSLSTISKNSLSLSLQRSYPAVI